ncbi:kelch repeat-containing protein [Sorangium sp. So ce128]|uniref:kelch repeat-containing protein n=1 Tax=Sorangium sp. So ce128 TaxID=3133281 RepID=UPI003F60D218
MGAAPLQDGRVLFSPGGLVYDPSTGTTTSVPLTPGEEVHGWEFAQTALTPLLSGLVLRTGGSDDDSVLREAVLYHPATNTWSSAGTMPVPRHLHTATKSSSWTFAQDPLIISLAPRECIVSCRARWPDEARRNVP